MWPRARVEARKSAHAELRSDREQFLLAAPFVIWNDEERAKADKQFVVMLSDFSFEPPAEILEKLVESSGMKMKSGGMEGKEPAASGMKMEEGMKMGGEPVSGACRDTVYVPPGSKLKIAFDANNPGIWAFHCHILYHGARGMFTVVKYEDTPTPFWKPEEASKMLKGLRE